MPNDDITLQSPQDDLNTDDNSTDPIREELGEDPAAELGIPPEELKKELDKQVVDDGNENLADDDVDVHDDQRENMEDLDEVVMTNN